MGTLDRMSEEKHWYVLHTYSGYEMKVKQNLESRMTSMGMEDNILKSSSQNKKFTKRKTVK